MERNTKRKHHENPEMRTHRVRGDQRLCHAHKRAEQPPHILHRQARFGIRRKRRYVSAHSRKRLREQKLDKQKQHRRATHDRGYGDEIVPNALINTFLVIAMADVAQNAVFVVHLKELDLVDLMPKHDTHQSMAQLVYGSSDKARCIANGFAIIDKLIKKSVKKGNDVPYPVHDTDKKGDL